MRLISDELRIESGGSGFSHRANGWQVVRVYRFLGIPVGSTVLGRFGWHKHAKSFKDELDKEEQSRG